MSVKSPTRSASKERPSSPSRAASSSAAAASPSRPADDNDDSDTPRKPKPPPPKPYEYAPPRDTMAQMPISYKTHLNEEIMANIRKGFKNSVYKPVQMSNGYNITFNDQRQIIIREGGYHNEEIDRWDSGHKKGIRRVAVWDSIARKTYVSAGVEGSARLFDVNGKFIKQLNHGDTTITSVLASDGEEEYVDALVVTGAADGSIKVWGIKTGKTRYTFKGHTRAIVDMCFVYGREDQLMLASVDARGEIRLWELATGECMREVGYFEASQRERRAVAEAAAEKERLEAIAKEKKKDEIDWGL